MKKLLFLAPIFLLASQCYYNEALYAYLKRDYPKAKKFFKLACDKNKNALGCYSFAQLTNDEKLKIIYEKKACKYGLKLACK